MKKYILLLICALLSINTFANDKHCSVAPDFVKLQQGASYTELDSKLGETLFESAGLPINTELIAAYEGDVEFTMNSEAPCMAIKNKYVRDTASGKTYLIVTSHEDYCDGGNVWGYVFDLEGSYKGKQSIVGEISDGALYCPKKSKYDRVQSFLDKFRWMN